MSEPASASGPLIDGIPLALWIAVGVAVLSAIVTLISVVLSNRNSRGNLREQLARGERQFAQQLAHDSQQLERRLAHEADQRDRERTMSLRREVYLNAAEAMILANGLIGRMTDLENDQRVLGQEFTVSLGKIAKIHIVGSQQTIDAVMNYVNTLSPAFIAMVSKRGPLLIRKAAIALEQTFIDAALGERKRFTEMLKQLNLDGVTDQIKAEPILAQSRLATKTHESHIATMAELWREQLKGIEEIVRNSQELAEKITRLLPPAILAVRSEMELPLDPEWYAGKWEEQLERVKKVMAKVYESIREAIDRQGAPPE